MYFRDFHPVPVSANLGEHEQCSGDRSGCDTIHILNVLRQLGVKSFLMPVIPLSSYLNFYKI